MVDVKYNLVIGNPPNSLINEEMYKEAFLHSLERDRGKFDEKYNYGEFEGDFEVRKSLADWFTKDVGCALRPENIMTNSGASSGIFSCISELLKHGDNMLIECPSNIACIKAFEFKAINLIPAVRSRTGTFDFVDLEQKIIKHNIKAFYLVTNFSNPTGINTSLEDRVKIYDLASKHRFYVFSDEAYENLYYDSKSRVLPLIYCNSKTAEGKRDHLRDYDLDQNEFIIGISSFSNTIFPQLRFGFIYAHKDIIKRIALTPLSYLPCGFKNINEHIFRSYIELGFLDKLIRDHREYIVNSISIAIRILSKNPYISFEQPEGGYFIFVYIDQRVDQEKLLHILPKNGIQILPGIYCIPENLREELTHFNRTVRLCFSVIDSQLIEEAVLLFNSLFESCLKDVI